HGFAHALLDQQLREKKIVKKYLALVTDPTACLQSHALIDLPIARDTTSLLKRQVSDEGKAAMTEYWCINEQPDSQVKLVEIQLHTGRTHQIRVHFSALACPLLGDELYGGSMEFDIQRQALHCAFLAFYHPFQKKQQVFQLALPCDMQKESQRLGK